MKALCKAPQQHTDRVQDSDNYPRMGELSEFARAGNPQSSGRSGIDSLLANHGSMEFANVNASTRTDLDFVLARQLESKACNVFAEPAVRADESRDSRLDWRCLEEEAR